MSSMTRRYVLKMGVLTAATRRRHAGRRAVDRAGPGKQSWSAPGAARTRRPSARPCSSRSRRRPASRSSRPARPTTASSRRWSRAATWSGTWCDVGDLNVIAGMKDNLLEPLDYQTHRHQGRLPPGRAQVRHRHHLLLDRPRLQHQEVRQGRSPEDLGAVLGREGGFPARGPCATIRPTIWSSRCWPTTCRSTGGIPWTSSGPSSSMDRIKPHVNVWWTTRHPAGASSCPTERWSWRPRGAAGSTRIQKQARATGLEWNQGKLQWDSWVIPRGSKNKDGAMKFIAWSTQPKPQAAIVNEIPYGPVNQKRLRVHRRPGGPGHADRAGKRQARR